MEQSFFGRTASVLLVVLSLSYTAFAQPLAGLLDFEMNVANNHLWRGIEVSDGMVMASTVAIHDTKRKVRVGLWGGANATGDYKEFNYFAELTHKGWKLALWDTYNFSPDVMYNNREFFNYSARSTGRFLDATLSYRFNGKTPLMLSWSTILFGRDRNADNTSNKYSTFVYISYPFYKSKCWLLEVGGGGAFALNHSDGTTFYSKRPGIIHVQLCIQRNVQITSGYAIPLYATMMWNPECNRAFFQIGAQLFSF